MEFEVGDTLTLEDNKDYVISKSKVIDDINYMLLIELPDYKSFRYVKLLNNESLEEINDIDIIEKLSELFNKA